MRSSLLEGAKMARFLLCRWKPHHMFLFTLSDLGSHADCSAPSGAHLPGSTTSTTFNSHLAGKHQDRTTFGRCGAALVAP